MTFSRFAGTLAALAAGLFVTAGAAQAFPAFTDKEGKPCGYCHINAKGSGPRNYRGTFYKEHNNSFAKFDDAAEAKKAGVEVGPDPDPDTKPKSWTAPDDASGTPAGGNDEPKTGEAEGPVKDPAKATDATPTMTLVQARKNYVASEQAYRKAPKNAARKKAFAEATAQLGRSTMMDQSIPPVRRYPAALKLYRQALSLDPKNKVALADRKQIEDVYKSMGRPVPK
jgi:tetratricopeptide (TPR) repeat protein